MTSRLSAYPYRTLCLWIAALALIWLTLSSPWSAGWNLLLGALMLFAILVGLVVATHHIQAHRNATRQVLSAIGHALNGLPDDLKRNTPLVLAVGDATGALAFAFGEDVVRITDSAIWVRVDEPARLMHLANALKYWRDGQGPDAVAYLIGADDDTDTLGFSAGITGWRSAIHEAGRAVGYRLPVCVALYLNEMTLPTTDAGVWFGVCGDAGMERDKLGPLVATRLTQYLQQATSPALPQAYRFARLDALVRWASQAILLPLNEAARAGSAVHIAALGVTTVPGMTAPKAMFSRFVTDTTGLQAPAVLRIGTASSWALPEPLLRGITPQVARPAAPRAAAHAFVWLALFFCAAAAASAWQNRALVRQVRGHVADYMAIDPAQDAARADALKALKRDRDALERFVLSGVPLRFGLGFYQGARLLPQLNRVIATYQPPAPPPSTIELNSMSLFKTGSAVLNPGSNRILVDALEMIKAHPDKRVLVAGHTDATGRPGPNVILSEARAASVRNWLADAANLPLSRFAIQGYGDTRPKAGNDTAEGRAANRRVDITLVPDCRNQRVTQGQTACLFN